MDMGQSSHIVSGDFDLTMDELRVVAAYLHPIAQAGQVGHIRSLRPAADPLPGHTALSRADARRRECKS